MSRHSTTNEWIVSSFIHLLFSFTLQVKLHAHLCLRPSPHFQNHHCRCSDLPFLKNMMDLLTKRQSVRRSDDWRIRDGRRAGALCSRLFKAQLPGVTGRRGERSPCPLRPPPGGYEGAGPSESDPRNETGTNPFWWP